ncbi:FecR family protein [Chryseolinea soli]|nr:FecR domain-containing protein [Chryseolinea soli]
MANKKKGLLDFLSGKKSEEGKKIFETWYNAMPETDHPEFEASEATLKEELAKIKNRGVVPLKQEERSPVMVYWKAAAVALLVVSAGILLYVKRDLFTKEEITYTEHYVPKGKLLQLSLSDGSQVWLNSDTKFRYPETFGSGDREVYLEGEAFFNVSKDPSRPFRIHSGGKLTTTVLGTSFNVKAYRNDDFNEVAVITGKVSVVHTTSDNRSSEVLLQPGQKAVLVKTQDLLSKETFSDVDHYTSWREGKLIFEDAPVADVISSLQRYYNIEINLSSETLKACRVTATFDPMPLEKVMYLLCFTLNAEYTHAGKKYSISGAGCNPNHP